MDRAFAGDRHREGAQVVQLHPCKGSQSEEAAGGQQVVVELASFQGAVDEYEPLRLGRGRGYGGHNRPILLLSRPDDHHTVDRLCRFPRPDGPDCEAAGKGFLTRLNSGFFEENQLSIGQMTLQKRTELSLVGL